MICFRRKKAPQEVLRELPRESFERAFVSSHFVASIYQKTATRGPRPTANRACPPPRILFLLFFSIARSDRVGLLTGARAATPSAAPPHHPPPRRPSPATLRRYPPASDRSSRLFRRRSPRHQPSSPTHRRRPRPGGRAVVDQPSSTGRRPHQSVAADLNTLRRQPRLRSSR